MIIWTGKKNVSLFVYVTGETIYLLTLQSFMYEFCPWYFWHDEYILQWCIFMTYVFYRKVKLKYQDFCSYLILSTQKVGLKYTWKEKVQANCANALARTIAVLYTCSSEEAPSRVLEILVLLMAEHAYLNCQNWNTG